jgi:hypothetical protein
LNQERNIHGNHYNMLTRSLATQSNGQFLSSINTDLLQSILKSWNTPSIKEKCTISTKNRSFPGGLQNSPPQPPWRVDREACNPNGQFLSSINMSLLKIIITTQNTHFMKDDGTISIRNWLFPGGLQIQALKSDCENRTKASIITSMKQNEHRNHVAALYIQSSIKE